MDSGLMLTELLTHPYGYFQELCNLLRISSSILFPFSGFARLLFFPLGSSQLPTVDS